MSVSPGFKISDNASIASSTGAPALTMMRIARGGRSAFVNSSKVNAGRKSPSPAYADMNSSVRVRVRL